MIWQAYFQKWINLCPKLEFFHQRCWCPCFLSVQALILGIRFGGRSLSSLVWCSLCLHWYFAASTCGTLAARASSIYQNQLSLYRPYLRTLNEFLLWSVRFWFTIQMQGNDRPSRFCKVSSFLPGLRKRGVECHVVATERVGHAREIGMTYDLRGFQVAVTLGGDGTFHELVNGLLARQDGQRVAVSLIPLGTGNGLAASLRQNMQRTGWRGIGVVWTWCSARMVLGPNCWWSSGSCWSPWGGGHEQTLGGYYASLCGTAGGTGPSSRAIALDGSCSLWSHGSLDDFAQGSTCTRVQTHLCRWYNTVFKCVLHWS